jgi:hypothetical protein
MDERKRLYDSSDQQVVAVQPKKFRPGTLFVFCCDCMFIFNCVFLIQFSTLDVCYVLEEILGVSRDDPDKVVSRLLMTKVQFSKVIGKGGNTEC